jgi:two-component system, chemotaxis family, protein-glutamate methylesterase/glutaminase
MELTRMKTERIVVIGASAGGIEALRSLVAQLPAYFAAPICIVVHTSPQSPGVIHDILNRAGPLSAISARSRERLREGRIYVAPPDCHLVVEPGRVRATKGPRENRFRPAIDPLFRSAAQVYGPAAIGVILTGNLDDGTAGLWAIKQLGGIAIVQDPDDALCPSMPSAALKHVRVDYRVALAEVAPLLVRLTSRPVQEEAETGVPEQIEVEVKIAKEENPVDAGLEVICTPSSFACPECHGVLLQLDEGGRIRFRCHTGHAYSVDSLLAAIGEGIEDSLWNAIRALEEGGLLMHRIAEHLRTHSGDGKGTARRLMECAEETRQHSETVRKLATEREPLVASEA